jgi:hypothetical protein
MIRDDFQLKKLIEMNNDDVNTAEERHQEIVHLGFAVLAAFTFVPLNLSAKSSSQKYEISKYLSEKLLDPSNRQFIESWLSFLKHPTSCINVLKAVYSLCLASPSVCLYLAKSSVQMNAIYEILAEKVILFKNKLKF